MRGITASVVWLLGCSIPDTRFSPTPDAAIAPPTLITDVAAGNTLTVDEAASVRLNIHLASQPNADVRAAVLLGPGPVTAAPASLVFTTLNYDIDQAVELTAAADANTVSEDQPLTLRAGSVDKLYTVHTIDRDVLNIQVEPPSLTITEAAGAELSVTLTQQPSTNVSVSVRPMSDHVMTNPTQLTFTPQDFAMVQVVEVSAMKDPEAGDDTDNVMLSSTTAGVPPRGVLVSIHRQQILADRSGTLEVTENGKAIFGVTLKRPPATPVIISVSSLDPGVATVAPEMLPFTSDDYMKPQTVTVTGTDDADQVSNTTAIQLSEPSIGPIEVPVKVTDDDAQPDHPGPPPCNAARGSSSGGGTFMVMLMVALIWLRRRRTS